MRLIPRQFVNFSVLMLAAGIAYRGAASPRSENLTRLVDLSIGETSARVFAEKLSLQIGTQITVSETISNRRFVCNLRNISAKDALGMIAELHNWDWFTRPNGSILIQERRRTMLRQQGQAPSIVQSLLSPDIRRYFGIGSNAAELPVPSESQTAQRIIRMKKNPQPFVERMIVWEIMPAKIEAGIRAASIALLFESVKVSLQKRQSLNVKDLTHVQQEMLAAAVYLRVLKNLSTSFGILYDDPEPYLKDWRTLHIRQIGNALQYGAVAETKYGSGFVGGGAPITDLQQGTVP